jgi:hypothetical protein
MRTLKNAENAENAKNIENAENTENGILSPSTYGELSFLLVKSLPKHRLTARIAILVSLPIFSLACYATVPGWAWFTARQIQHPSEQGFGCVLFYDTY